MRFAVIGSGFAGLSCALELLKAGHEVEVFEKSETVGGLASGFKDKSWNWHLEHFYHHIFANDNEIIDLAKEVDCPAYFKNPKTSSFINEKILTLDSPASVLTFDELKLLDRLRMGFGLLILKLIPNGLFLENKKAVVFLPKLIGQVAYKKIWKKLLTAKFGPYVDQVNMAWFWSRVAKRTKSLGYFEGGFDALLLAIAKKIKNLGGQIHLGKQFEFSKNIIKKYNKIILTTPAPVAEKITGQSIMPKIDYLSAQTLVLILKKSLMSNYWLNILEDGWPFLVAVEHTRFADKEKYGGETIVYFGNYLPENDTQMSLSKERIIEKYLPFIKNINPKFNKEWIKRSYLFRASYAQPVFPVNYSKMIKNINKKNSKIWFANMSMIYPYDRGTNYAIQIGKDVARQCLKLL